MFGFASRQREIQFSASCSAGPFRTYVIFEDFPHGGFRYDRKVSRVTGKQFFPCGVEVAAVIQQTHLFVRADDVIAVDLAEFHRMTENAELRIFRCAESDIRDGTSRFSGCAEDQLHHRIGFCSRLDDQIADARCNSAGTDLSGFADGFHDQFGFRAEFVFAHTGQQFHRLFENSPETDLCRLFRINMNGREIFLLNRKFFRAQRMFDKGDSGNAAGFADPVGGQVIAGMNPVTNQTDLLPCRSRNHSIGCNVAGTLNAVNTHSEVSFAERKHIVSPGIIHRNRFPGFQKPLYAPVASNSGNFAGGRGGVVCHRSAAHVADIHLILRECLIAHDCKTAEKSCGG